MGRRNLWVDLKAEREDTTIYVEIKGFETRGSIVEYLYTTTGQYVAYQSIIRDLDIQYPLYLAVPEQSMQGILDEKLGKLVTATTNMRLLEFDIQREDITAWQPSLS